MELLLGEPLVRFYGGWDLHASPASTRPGRGAFRDDGGTGTPKAVPMRVWR